MTDLLLAVPRHLDDPPKFLLWDFDVAFVFLSVMVMGLLAGFFFIPLGLGCLAAYGLQKMKQGKQRGYGVHVLYWYLPVSMGFKRTPPSYLRQFIG